MKFKCQTSILSGPFLCFTKYKLKPLVNKLEHMKKSKDRTTRDKVLCWAESGCALVAPTCSLKGMALAHPSGIFLKEETFVGMRFPGNSIYTNITKGTAAKWFPQTKNEWSTWDGTAFRNVFNLGIKSGTKRKNQERKNLNVFWEHEAILQQMALWDQKGLRDPWSFWNNDHKILQHTMLSWLRIYRISLHF